MPLWTIHHSPGILTDADKHRLATRITDHYAQVGLPRFYVITLFQETRPEDFYVGGEPAPAGVRITIDHIARRNPDRGARRRTARWIRSILAPYLAERTDLHWEFHVDETSADLWMINGIAPPPGESDVEKQWAAQNSVSPY
ncbi:tautomerase family protein [Nocardia bovistercoris]|uniref:Tautomerase family protein n=1 Tax=Nocardia bovistercoris TaxID=2785916 RepID=A0A931ICV5_9NOCA|nr:tautomerase family protein [Nocardia bovistercoris]